MLELKLLLILIVGNGVPVILYRWLGDTLSQPVDGGYELPDGTRLFGCSKTWRGFLAGIIGSAIAAFLLEFTIVFGLVFGFLSLSGDLASSFIKRRRKRPESSKSIGIDQVPEALIPLLFGAFWLNYGVSTIIIVTLSFFLLNVFVSPILYQFGIRKHPY